MPFDPDFLDILHKAGKVMAARRQAMEGDQPPPIDPGHRDVLQAATLGLIREMNNGVSSEEAAEQMVQAGWTADGATGFLMVVRRLMYRMHRGRAMVFLFFSFTGIMLASVLVPIAYQGEIGWSYAILVSVASLFFVSGVVIQWVKSKRYIV